MTDRAHLESGGGSGSTEKPGGDEVRTDGGGLTSGRTVDGAEPATGPDVTTTVDVKCTGLVQEVVGEMSFEYTFEGDTLREFLAAFFAEYDVEEMLIAATEAEA